MNKLKDIDVKELKQLFQKVTKEQWIWISTVVLLIVVFLGVFIFKIVPMRQEITNTKNEIEEVATNIKSVKEKTSTLQKEWAEKIQAIEYEIVPYDIEVERLLSLVQRVGLETESTIESVNFGEGEVGLVIEQGEEEKVENNIKDLVQGEPVKDGTEPPAENENELPVAQSNDSEQIEGLEKVKAVTVSIQATHPSLEQLYLFTAKLEQDVRIGRIETLSISSKGEKQKDEGIGSQLDVTYFYMPHTKEE